MGIFAALFGTTIFLPPLLKREKASKDLALKLLVILVMSFLLAITVEAVREFGNIAHW